MQRALFLVEVAGRRMLRIRRPWLPFRSPADTSRLDSPPDCLTELGPSQGSIPNFIIMNIKKGSWPFFIFMVEVAGIEPASESISGGVSPSAASNLLFRLLSRPEAG